MKIKFSPVRLDYDIVINVEGDVIMIEGESFDFSPLNEGDILPASAINSNHFVDNVTRENGEITVTVVLPHGVNAPYERRFPVDVDIDFGSVELPEYDIKVEEPDYGDIIVGEQEVVNEN